MKAESVRQQRVSDAIREEIASSIIHDVKDPRVKGLITVTKVEVTGDLRLARIYVSIINQTEDKNFKPDEVLKGLRHAVGFFKARLGKNANLRHIPDLEFKADEGMDYSEKIEQILKEIKK